MWLNLELSRLPRRLRLAEANLHALGIWSAFTRSLGNDGIDLEINQKNSLFAASKRGARRWPTVASLIETVKFDDFNS